MEFRPGDRVKINTDTIPHTTIPIPLGSTGTVLDAKTVQNFRTPEGALRIRLDYPPSSVPEVSNKCWFYISDIEPFTDPMIDVEEFSLEEIEKAKNILSELA